MNNILCEKNFNTKYAYVNNIRIDINNIETIDINNLKCKNGHYLIPICGNIKKHHFRHKNTEDLNNSNKSEWHCEWQGYFEDTEISFPKINENQIKDRRADIFLKKYNKVIEIQHSKISETEVNERKIDYKLNNIDTIWIIDGEESIIIKKLDYSNRIYLEFVKDFWKYESFIEYDFIFIDINELIYKIYPKKIKSHMTDIENPKPKDDFINNYLKNNIEIWSNEEPIQCNMYIKQEGAGNGKTFGIIQMLENDTMYHYNNFIYITKQHSAKTVIFKEFTDQIKQKQLTYIINVKNYENNKKYIIEFFNTKFNKECKIIIATVDSLMYSIGNKNHTYLNKFEGLILSIFKDEYIDCYDNGKIIYAGINPKLNKETLLIIDETQDLTIDYSKALCCIMRDRYIDIYIVGDKLQSISFENNAFVYLSENSFENINKINIEPKNICRRFIHPILVDFVNNMIQFNNYNLPSILPYKIDIDNLINDPLIIFSGESIYVNDNSDENEVKINIEIEKIMEQFKNEVELYNRIPEDFLIITPFTKNNPLVESLELTINIYWKNKFSKIDYIQNVLNNNEYWKDNINSDEYYRYAIFHKSEDGTSINLDESLHSTRIVSCHSSKGDGRNVVFLIGFNELSIQKFSKITENLIYDSLFHVAITRMKQKMYIRLENNGDNFTEKIKNYSLSKNILFIQNENPKLHIYNKLKYDNDIINNILNHNFQLLYNNIIKKVELKKIDNNEDEKKVIDIGNHNIRYCVLIINIIIEIINKENINKNSEIKKQLLKILLNVSKSEIFITSDWKIYNKHLIDKNIAIIKLTEKGIDYINYFEILKKCMINIITKLKENLKNDNIPFFCPYESIILLHMIEITEKKSLKTENKPNTIVNIMDIYNITDIYNNIFEKDIKGHENCICNECFINKKNNTKINENDSLKKYILSHYEKINNIKEYLTILYEIYPNINWLFKHPITYNGFNKSFKINKTYNLIGYDDKNIIIGYIKPQFNDINYNEILKNSIFDIYLLKNVKKFTITDGKKVISNNYIRFNNKNIIISVFSIDLKIPYYIKFIDKDNNDLINNNILDIQNMIFEQIFNKFSFENNNVYMFFKFNYENCKIDNKTPLTFIDYFINEYNNIKIINEKNSKEYPEYIIEFINKIKNDLINCKKSKERKILLDKYYIDKNYFMKEINKILEYSIKRFLNIKIEYDESESDSEIDDNL